MPVIGFEAFQIVVGIAELGRPVERDQVVVIEHDQLAQAQRSRQCAGLVRDAFHQVAVAAQRIRVVIHNLEPRPIVDSAQVLLGNRHADGHRQALSERAGRYFNTIRVAVLGMPRSARVPLAKALQIVNRHVVAGKKQRAIQQRRSVPVRKHKAIAVGPL